MHSFAMVSVPRRHQGFNVEVLASVTEQNTLTASERRSAWPFMKLIVVVVVFTSITIIVFII